MRWFCFGFFFLLLILIILPEVNSFLDLCGENIVLPLLSLLLLSSYFESVSGDTASYSYLFDRFCFFIFRIPYGATSVLPLSFIVFNNSVCSNINGAPQNLNNSPNSFVSISLNL